MNQKLAKKIRVIAFTNTPSSEERKTRKWAVAEDRKHHTVLLCLDPRATYKMMKVNFKGGSKGAKTRMRKEINYLQKTVKHDFPKGIALGYEKSFLGQKLQGMVEENAAGATG